MLLQKNGWNLLLIAVAVLVTTNSLAAPGRWRNRIRDRLTTGQMQRYEINVNGKSRAYYLYRPRQSSSIQPLLIGLHGGQTTATRFAETTEFNALAAKKGFAVAYPEGTNKQWNDGRDTPKLSKQDDIAFLRAVITDAETKLTPLSQTREVYITGISNGGFMAQRAACELSDKIIAVASVASTMAEPIGKSCKLQKPLSVMLIGSPDDRFVPWQGGEMQVGTGGRILSMDETMSGWQKRLNCSVTGENKKLPNTVQDGTTVTINLKNCGDRTNLTLIRIDGGGHAWPQGKNQPEKLVGKTSQQFNGSEYIWDFFQRQGLWRQSFGHNSF
jgi:polyhydroxybutyrate depolymerase